MHGRPLIMRLANMEKFCSPLNKSIVLTRAIFSKSRSENLKMTEHSNVTPGNLDFDSNNNLIRVWWADCY